MLEWAIPLAQTEPLLLPLAVSSRLPISHPHPTPSNFAQGFQKFCSPPDEKLLSDSLSLWDDPDMPLLWRVQDGVLLPPPLPNSDIKVLLGLG